MWRTTTHRLPMSRTRTSHRTEKLRANFRTATLASFGGSLLATAAAQAADFWLAPASAVTGVSAANFDIDVCWSAAPRAAICSSAASCSASRYLDVDRGTRPAARVFGRQPFDVTFATQIARGGVNQNFFRTPSDAGIVRHHRPLTNALTADCEKFGDGTGQTLGFQAEKSNKRCCLSNSYLDLFNRG